MEDKIFALRTLLIILIAFLFLSCDGFLDFIKVNDDDSSNFWAYNYTTNKDYKVKAELIIKGAYCNVWVEKNSGVSKTQAKNIADEYDGKIHELMINTFGIENPSYNDETFSDIMEVADYLGDEDGKLCILLLDIKDDYQKGVNESYVAGYFWAGNFYSMSGSNQRDMIYIDTNPGMKGEKNIENAFTTLAHEMQHMMNFVTRRVKNSNALMDVWIDEGLSSAAEYIVSGGDHSLDRIDWYNENGDNKANIKGLIDQGNNFFVWDNHKENRYAILDDYSTVYLFFQWLRLQKGIGVYRDIISSNYTDYQAVENAMGEDWDTLLKNWMAANYINDSTGEYGYKSDIPEITAHTAPAGITRISLYPGEGVYSLTDASDTMPAQGVNIKYAGLDKTSVTVSDSAVFAAGRLLTYNINTLLSGRAETGITTGIAASVNIAHKGRSAVSSYSGPYRIGAGDILSRNGKNRDFPLWDTQDK
ncbi:M30 family metallopeptidase [Treponema sp. R80B11-R83G3]